MSDAVPWMIEFTDCRSAWLRFVTSSDVISGTWRFLPVIVRTYPNCLANLDAASPKPRGEGGLSHTASNQSASSRYVPFRLLDELPNPRKRAHEVVDKRLCLLHREP